MKEFIVLGMHRSGTSLLSSLLDGCGVYFGEPEDFIPVNEENPRGFWERKAVRQLNDDMLHSMNADWDELLDYNPSLFDLEEHQGLMARAENVLSLLHDESDGAIVGLKEPRFCLLMGAWSSALNQEHLALVVVRNPADVAYSLHRRNRMPMEVAYYLIGQYQSHLAMYLEGRTFVSVSYENLLAQPLLAVEKLSADIYKASGVELDFGPELISSVVEPALNRSAGKELVPDNWGHLLEANDCLLRGDVFKFKSLPSDDLSVLRYQYGNRFSISLDYERKFREIESDHLRLRVHAKQLDSKTKVLELQRLELDSNVKYLVKKLDVLKRNAALLEESLDVFFSTRFWRGCRLVLSALVRLKPGVGRKTILDQIDRYRGSLRDWRRNFSYPHVLLPFRHTESELLICDTARPVETSLIILTRDGIDHLKCLLGTVGKFHDLSAVEIIIVDHASKDSSIEFVKSVMGDIPIRLFEFDENYTFSFSNNFAAKKALGKNLVFCNNDIIFDVPVIKALCDPLQNENVGIVGLPLYYATESKQRSSALQHAGVGFRYDTEFDFYRPYNIQSDVKLGQDLIEVKCVTAALAACRKVDFLEVGGFDEGYNYGYEDVDLCLSLKSRLAKYSVLNTNVSAIHDESATQKQDERHLVSRRRRENIKHIKHRFGRYLKKQMLMERFSTRVDGGNGFRVGLVVTEDDQITAAGDYFTASELATELRDELGWSTKFLPQRNSTVDWYDAEGLDCILVLLDGYDLTKVYNKSPELLSVAWLRNWFDRWAERPWFSDFDLALCSSDIAADFIGDSSIVPVDVLRIAANHNRFHSGLLSDPDRSSDYCFTGSYWGSKRDIEELDPSELPYEFALYGEGWAKHQRFATSYKGLLPYHELPAVYSSTRVLVDDANHVTKPWGSVNSRVFDALASGVLVITNGELGAKEVFGPLLPAYDGVDDLKTKLSFYLENEAARVDLAGKLQAQVLGVHTYRHRAREFKQLLFKHFVDQVRIAIKLPVPSWDQANQWGDYHLGCALAAELGKLGYRVRLDILPEWYEPQRQDVDVVLVIRGLSEYEPRAEHINVMWQISHPDKVNDSEYEKYDHIFVASEKYTKRLSGSLSVPVTPLLQCTDPERFYYDPYLEGNESCLFVGNSRKHFRPIVKAAVEEGLDVSVYGTLWEGFIGANYIKGQHIPNESLREYYTTCGVLLNDHWDTMRREGFISNRMFDALACGANIISDRVEGISELFSDVVHQYSPGQEALKVVVERAKGKSGLSKSERLEISRTIHRDHSFNARAKSMHEIFEQLQKTRRPRRA